MRRSRSLGLLGLLLVTGSFTAPAASAAPPQGIRPLIFKRACGTPPPGHVACAAIQVTDANGNTPPAEPALNLPDAVGPATAPGGYGPSDLRNAYNLASAAAANGGTEKVAIVDAFDDPNAAADLATYRSTYGLPACGAGCFTKVNQTGGTTYPSPDAGWSEEISLDIEMVSAICPNCKILLVEASGSTIASLGAAVNEAASLGATQISNSYGGGETSSETADSANYFRHPGIDITVSSGDDGYGVEFPAASQYVTAVGGTSLTPAGNARGWTESAWSGAGSGCSAYIPKPAWQSDAGCPRRTVADVSAVADPNTAVAVYDSYRAAGWMEFGGTSVATPIVASVDALAGGRSPLSTFGSFAYGHPADFNDVVAGSNGSCGGSYLCTGLAGYDGPTGVGSPAGAAPVAPPTPVPVISVAPTVSGTPTQGHTLTATPGTWTNSPTSFTYQWYDCPTTATTGCTSLGATAAASTYVLPGGYTGYITAGVTATNAGGPSAPAFASPAVGPVQELPPVNSTPPTISGSLVQGQTLTAAPGTWTNSPTSFTYQWYDCPTSATTGCTSLGAAAAKATYSLPAGYTGFVDVTVAAHNAGGASPAVSARAAVGPISPPPPPPPPSFTLTASPTSQSVGLGASASYRITVVGQGGFNGSVTFAATGLPAGVTASFSPASATGSTTLTLTSTRSSPTGAHAIPVVGSSGSLRGSTTVTLTLTGTCFFGICF